MSLSLNANTITSGTISNSSGTLLGSLNVSGSITTNNSLYCNVSSAVATASVTTTNYITLPAAGVYILLVSQTNGESIMAIVTNTTWC